MYTILSAERKGENRSIGFFRVEAWPAEPQQSRGGLERWGDDVATTIWCNPRLLRHLDLSRLWTSVSQYLKYLKHLSDVAARECQFACRL